MKRKKTTPLASSTLEPAAAAILVLDSNGRIIQANGAAERLAGVPVLLRDFGDVFPLRSVSGAKELTFQQILAALRRHGNTKGLQALARMPGGDTVTVMMNADLLTGAEAPVPGCIITLWDISALRLAEESLRASEDQYRTLFHSIDQGFCIIEVLFDANGKANDYRFLDVNPAFEKLTGLEGAIGRRASECVPNLEPQWFEVYGKVALTGVPARLEQPADEMGRLFDCYAFRIGPPEQRRLAVLFNGIMERNRREAHIAFLADLAKDYGRFSSAEEIMRASAEKLKNHLKISDCLFADIDEARDTATVAYASRSAEMPDVLGVHRLSEYASEKLLQAARAGETMAIRNTQTDPRTNAKSFAALGIYSCVAVPFHCDGEWKFLFSVNDSAPRDWRPDEIELIREVTSRVFPRLERARAEEALRASEARERAYAAELQAIMEAAPVAMLVAQDPECRVITGNRLTYEILRLPPGSNVSKSAPPGQAPTSYRIMKDGREIPPQELPAQKAAATGQPVRNYEFDVVFEDGTSRTLLGDAVPLFGEDGRPRGVVCAFVDITDNKRAQERLRQTQKLESIGLLAGGIAHDFNNLLTAIMGNASLVLGEVSAGTAERIRNIVTSAERAAHLTRQLLAYSGKGQVVIRDLNVAEAVREIGDLVQFSIPSSVRLSVAVEGRLPVVRMDPGQLQQILMNLVINAGEAIGEGNPGRITVTTSMADVTKAFVCAAGEEVTEGHYVTIEVSDTGEGIAEEKRPRIFEPFFTTKFTGRGLGLAAVAGILRSVKGGITVRSEPERGSTFLVYLPAAGGQSRGAREQSAAGEDGTILVVDDEASVRDFIGEVLRNQGYRVLLARDGREALEVCKRHGGTINAAVVDVVMPVMGAIGLLPALKAQQPKIRILLTSGYGEAEARRLSEAHPDATFIQKPYTAEQIAEAVEELLLARRRPRTRTVPPSKK